MSLTPLGSCSYVVKLAVTYLIAPLKRDRQRVCPITIKVSDTFTDTICGLFTRWICVINPKDPSGVSV